MTFRVLSAMSLIALGALACSVFVGGPAYPDPPVPISTEDAQALESDFSEALAQSAQSGVLTVEFTEGQLTSFVASRLAEQSELLITQPQVTLRDGVMRLYGRAQSGVFVANLSVTTEFGVDQDGQPKITIQQAEFGPLSAPPGLVKITGAFLQETLTGSLGTAATGFRLASVAISDGKMTLTGRLK